MKTNWCIKGGRELAEWVKEYDKTHALSIDVEGNDPNYHYYIKDTDYPSTWGYSTIIPRGRKVIKVSELDKYMNRLSKSVNTSDPKITIPAELLRKGYMEATDLQREYIREHVDAYTGETTLNGLKCIYDLVCEDWKNILEQEFPELKDRSVDLSKNEVDGRPLFKHDGGHMISMIAVRITGQYDNKAFFLSPDYNWELTTDRETLILVPTRK